MPVSKSMNKTASKEQQIDLQYLFSVIYRRKKYISYPVIIAVLIAAVLCFILPREYVAYSTILVHNKRMVDPLISPLAVTPDIRGELKTLSKQVMSWPRMEQLVIQLDLIDEDVSPVKLERFIRELKKKIYVGMKGRELIEIRYHDRDPELAQKITNTITQNFLDESSRQKREDAQNAIDFISEQLKIYQKKLEDSGKNFSISKVDSDLRIARNKKNLLDDKKSKIVKFVQQSITRERSPVIYQLQTQLGSLQADLARLMVDAKEGNPRVHELKKRITSIKSKVRREKEKETITESVSITNPEYLRVDQELKQVEMDIAYLKKRKRDLVVAGVDESKPITEEQLSTLEHSKHVDEDIYQMLLKQLEAAYVSERFQDSDKGSKFTVIEYARLPLIPTKPNKKKLLVMGFLLGCAIGAGIIFLMEHFNDSFKTVDGAKDFMNVPFMGAVSRMVLVEESRPSTLKELGKALRGLLRRSRLFSLVDFVDPHEVKRSGDSAYSPFLVTYHEPATKSADEYRVLRARLLNLMADKKQNVFAITSVGKGEGKSTCAANIAVAMARDGRKTLLVDCDLRKGTLHDIFGVSHSPGLIHAVKNPQYLDKIIVKTDVDNLNLIVSGGSIADPSEFLDVENVKTLFEQFKRDFDVAIIDVPPVSNLPDTYILGKLVQFVILAVQMHKTQKANIENISNDLLRAKIDIGGFILTDTQCTVPLYLNDYYYYQ